ncbi:MAG: serine--tRNA ligase [Candidatus Coatesbacteria bacterium]
MIDPKLLKDSPDKVREMLTQRNAKVEFGALKAADDARRVSQIRADELRAKRNTSAQEFGKLKKAGTADSPEGKALMDSMRGMDAAMVEAAKVQADAEAAYHELVMLVPNMPHETTPVGKSGDDNVEVRKWGTPREFDFTAKPHWDICESLGLVDFERAIKISGARFTLFTGQGARLERALIQFMLDLHTTKHGYTEVSPPILVRSESLEGTGQLPNLREEMYHIPAPDDLWLNPTAEVPIANIHREEILDGARLPVKYVGYLPSFRREAGAAGRDTRGLLRVHQFDKVEMFQFVRPEDSIAAHEEMVGHAEAVLKALELPYRLMLLCTADISQASMKTYDPEVWMPGQRQYREIASVSTCSDYQARRAQIRFRREAGGKAELVHTLNGSGLAVGRTFAALLENFQQADGSVVLPDAIRPYMGGLSILK